MDGNGQEICFQDPQISLRFSSQTQEEKGMGNARKISGATYRKVIFPNIFNCLNELSEITKIEFVILIDEWSNLPLSIQPHFAEFLRCCLIPSSHITVKIAAVEARTKFFIKKDNVVYGLEVGADISIDIDLDSLYMFDKNPRKMIVNLYEMLLNSK